MPPFFDASSPASRTGGARASSASLRVHVADVAGLPIARCLVALRRVAGHTGPDVPCRYDARGRCYAANGLAAGEYLLIAQVRGLAAHRRRMLLVPGLTEVTVVLGPPDAACLPRGQGVMPLLADGATRVAVQLDVAGDEGAARAVLETARALRLEGRPVPREVTRDGVLVFDVPPQSHAGTTPVVQQERLRGVLQQLTRTPGVRHAGTVLPGTATTVAFLTRDAVVAIDPALPAERVRTFAGAHGFDVVRPLACRPGLWHLRTDEMPTLGLLARLQAMGEASEVAWIEPSLVVAGAPETPPAGERAPRDPHDAAVARLPAAEALIESLRIEHGARPASIVVVASHGVDRLGPDGPVALVRGGIGSDLDLVDRLEALTAGDGAADVVLLLPAIGAGLPPSAMVQAAIDALTERGRQGAGAVVLLPHVVAAAGTRAVASMEQPLALHPAVVVVNASTLDPEGREGAAAGISDGLHVTVCAPASQSPVVAAPATASRLVAEVVRLMLAVHPRLPAAEVRRLLRATAERIDLDQATEGAWLDVRGEPAAGTGALPAFSSWYGYGRVDALRAVAAAHSRRPSAGVPRRAGEPERSPSSRRDGGEPPHPASPLHARPVGVADVMVSGGHGVEGLGMGG